MIRSTKTKSCELSSLLPCRIAMARYHRLSRVSLMIMAAFEMTTYKHQQCRRQCLGERMYQKLVKTKAPSRPPYHNVMPAPLILPALPQKVHRPDLGNTAATYHPQTSTFTGFAERSPGIVSFCGSADSHICQSLHVSDSPLGQQQRGGDQGMTQPQPLYHPNASLKQLPLNRSRT